MTRRKAVAGAMGETLTVARGGTYIADREMAARLARGDRPIFEDIRAASKRVEEGDTLRLADLHPWVLAALVANGMVVMDPDVPPWSTLGDETDTDEPEPELRCAGCGRICDDPPPDAERWWCVDCTTQAPPEDEEVD